MVMAAPSSTEWPLGQFDIVISNMDSDQQWPQSGLTGKSCPLCYTFDSVGHCVAQIHLIFWINNNSQNSGLFLAYLQCFDVIPQPSGSTGQVSDLTSGLYALK